MTNNQSNQFPISQKAKLIFNPHAGAKRKILPNPNSTSLEDIKDLIERYQIPVDYHPTKAAGHAKELAHDAIKEGYKYVLVAGGDGTVGEAANGLVGSETPLGILPLGTFMNIAKMLSIPLEIEKAVLLIKIGRIRKIDVGAVTKMGGEKMESPYYFLESAGIGLNAQLHQNVSDWEKGDWKAIFKFIKTWFDFYGYPGTITLDDKIIKTRATLAAVSNGPYSSANLPLAPKAKLNDHRLTLILYKMSKFELINYFLNFLQKGKRIGYQKIETYQAKKSIKIQSKVKRLVHADARLFGETPVEFKIVPSALSVISGFPDKGDSSLVSRTLLDP